MASARYTSFASVPVNRNARRSILREARLGTRSVPPVIDYGDALEALDAARAYKQGWQSSTQDFPAVVRASWAAR